MHVCGVCVLSKVCSWYAITCEQAMGKVLAHPHPPPLSFTLHTPDKELVDLRVQHAQSSTELEQVKRILSSQKGVVSSLREEVCLCGLDVLGVSDALCEEHLTPVFTAAGRKAHSLPQSGCRGSILSTGHPGEGGGDQPDEEAGARVGPAQVHTPRPSCADIGSGSEDVQCPD